VKHEAWGRWAEALGVGLDPKETQALETFESLLADRAVQLGLISSGDRNHLRERHVVDSLRAAPLIGLAPRGVMDLGSGAGLPGIPLALVRPDLRFRLVDAQRRRVSFLELVVDSLELSNVEVIHGRIESLAGDADVCLARALADPTTTWSLAGRFLPPAGKLLYWAGRSFDEGSVSLEGAQISLSRNPALADAGPVVIMTRQ